MIAIELFITLAVIAGILALYGLIDNRNKFYTNIGSLFISSLICWYLSVTIGNGTLQSGVMVNQTSGAAIPIILQDESLGWLIMIPAVAAMIVTLYLVYEAWEENKQNKITAEEAY